jgi:hypothetical protein
MKFIQVAILMISFACSSAFASDWKQEDPYFKLNMDAPSKISPEESLLIANVAYTAAAGIGALNMNSDQDKTRHFLAGYFAGNVTRGALEVLLPAKMENKKLITTLLGIGASVLAGVGKEVWDSMGHGTPDFKDALATSAGGVVGSFSISFDLQNSI